MPFLANLKFVVSPYNCSSNIKFFFILKTKASISYNKLAPPYAHTPSGLTHKAGIRYCRVYLTQFCTNKLGFYFPRLNPTP